MTDLLHVLRRRANSRGLVVVSEVVLLEDVRSDQPTLRRCLEQLEASGEVEIRSPLPFLVVKLGVWPGEAPKAHSAYSYSKQLLNKQQLKDSYRTDASTANDGLLHEILKTLGETDPDSFRKAIENYAPHVIRLALNRVRRAKNIRKNRTALFRHLLPRLARDQQPDQTTTP